MNPESRRPSPPGDGGTPFQPVFDDRYDEVTKPNLELRVPAYFLKQWSPRLSPSAALLYLQLRLMCWYDEKNPKNTRDYCWPKQATLAQLIGSSRRSVQRHLKELEQLGLIRRKETRYYDTDKGKKLRGVDIYQVPYRVPVTPEDAAHGAPADVEQILKSASASPRRQNGALVPYPQPRRQIGVGTAAPKLRTEVVPEVQENVWKGDNTRREQGLRAHPALRAMTSEQRAARKKLANSIGDQLSAMTSKLARRRGTPSEPTGPASIANLLASGSTDARQHKDYGFHWIVAHFLPQAAIASALTATEDAVEDEIQGNRALLTSPGRYFTGVIKRICAAEGIELPGVAWNVASEASKRPQERRNASVGTE